MILKRRFAEDRQRRILSPAVGVHWGDVEGLVQGPLGHRPQCGHRVGATALGRFPNAAGEMLGKKDSVAVREDRGVSWEVGL